MQKIKLGDYDVTVLEENILVFHNVLRDPQGLINFYENHQDWWGGWYGFGRQVTKPGPVMENHPGFPEWEQWKAEMIDSVVDDDHYRKEIAEVFYKTTKEYIAYTGKSFDVWTTQNFGIARYIPDEDLINNDDLTMVYHTDYQQNMQDQPGNKYAITSVIYPNDNYEGGEISIRKVDPETNLPVVKIDYKPKANDMIFFPSDRPYYHGVKRIWKAPKYIIRLYWLYAYDGSPEWHALKEKYGKDFKELEDNRIRTQEILIADPFQRPRITIDEYYQIYEMGLVEGTKIRRIPEGIGVTPTGEWTN